MRLKSTDIIEYSGMVLILFTLVLSMSVPVVLNLFWNGGFKFL